MLLLLEAHVVWLVELCGTRLHHSVDETHQCLDAAVLLQTLGEDGGSPQRCLHLGAEEQGEMHATRGTPEDSCG